VPGLRGALVQARNFDRRKLERISHPGFVAMVEHQ
jgi:hypothetical protein